MAKVKVTLKLGNEKTRFTERLYYIQALVWKRTGCSHSLISIETIINYLATRYQKANYKGFRRIVWIMAF